MAVQDGRGRARRWSRSRTRARARSDATLDALVFDAPDVRIVGEVVHPVTYCLSAPRADRAGRGPHGPLAPAGARPVRALPRARSCRAPRSWRRASTADAVRAVAEGDALAGEPARGDRDAARRRAVRRRRARARASRTRPDNATRFAWIAPRRDGAGAPGDGPGQDARSSSGAAATSPGLARALPVASSRSAAST